MTIGCTPKEIVACTGARQHGHSEQLAVRHLLIDSRKLVFPAYTLFFAIVTERANGHDYIDDLFRSGVRQFLVSQLPEIGKFPGAIFYETEDVVLALQKLAAAHRLKFNIPVIGLTGSNGKTIVKEWLYHLLQDVKNIVRSPRSYNSQLGVPLSVWQMEEYHTLGIFEAGISLGGEMDALRKVIQPTIGLITNLGDAHSEGFVSKEEKLLEKLRLFQGTACVIFNADQTAIRDAVQYLKQSGQTASVFSWGRDPDCDLVIFGMHILEGSTAIQLKSKGRTFQFNIPFVDEVAIENAMHAFACCVALGLEDAAIDKMSSLPPLSMRLEIKEGIHGCKLINDSYNADVSGVLSALEFMRLQDMGKKRNVILSDISGVPSNPFATYQEVALFMAKQQVKKLFVVGTEIQRYTDLFVQNGILVEWFPHTEALLHQLQGYSFRDELILIKGARHFHFEKVSAMLESKVHQTRLEVDLAAIAHNYRLFKNRLSPETHMMVMVKAFSYGAGSLEIARLLQFHHADHIAVAYVDEGVELRKAGIHLPIMVMNTEPGQFQPLIDHDLEPEIYSLEIIRLLDQFLKSEGIRFFPVHLKLDTGMHRLGLSQDDISAFLDEFAKSPSFRIKTIFTHLVASEDAGQDAFTQQQLQQFDNMTRQLQLGLGYTCVRHAANTAAISRHPNAEFEMVRLGIGLYGIDTTHSFRELKEAVALKTTIAQIRSVNAGEAVGYGRHAILHRESRIATIRIGYADGFPRSLGNGKGKVWIAGQLYPTVGNVCMDMTMVDITGNETIGLDEEVVIFGPDHPLETVARDAMTIPYEIMTGISQRVPRIYHTE